MSDNLLGILLFFGLLAIVFTVVGLGLSIYYCGKDDSPGPFIVWLVASIVFWGGVSVGWAACEANNRPPVAVGPLEPTP